MSFVVWSGKSSSFGRLRVIAPVTVAKLLCRWVEKQSSHKSDGGVASNGTFWYRYSRPWLPLFFESCAFGFRLSDRAHTEGLLFHAQQLDGVFDSKLAAFLAVFVSDRQLRIVVKPNGASNVQWISMSSPVDDEIGRAHV